MGMDVWVWTSYIVNQEVLNTSSITATHGSTEIWAIQFNNNGQWTNTMNTNGHLIYRRSSPWFI